MENKKNSMVPIFTIACGFFVSIIRCIMNQHSDTDTGTNEIAILNYMSVVNVIALGVVIVYLINSFKCNCMQRIANTGLATKEKLKCNKVLNILIGIASFILFVIGVVYLLFVRSATVNDIFSVMALCISISSDGLLEEYGESFYILISKIKKKTLD